ncbi:MAG: NAD-dependent epimerase/dehydratase family protein [Candidatus Aminicenantes bacterium]|nr:NAD-dependent epimerase/dehydratase family protein [Candidatus Aminicenantes bacterium]
MNVLVIGGARFLGWHTVRRLLRAGHEVTLFNRGVTPDDFGGDVRRLRGDRRDGKAFASLAGARDWGAVVDLVAYNAQDSRSAVEALRGRAGHFIHISTGAVYLVTRDYPCPLREEDYEQEVTPRPEGDDRMWVYGTEKRDGEDVLAEAHARDGFPFTSLRLPIVIGERDYTLRAFSYFLRAGDGKPVLLPDGGLCPSTHVYAGDVAAAVAANLGNPAAFGRAYNLAQGEAVTVREFVLKAAAVLGTKPEIVDVPKAVLDRQGWGRGFSPFSVRRPFILSIERAARELGFVPSPFEDWLAATVLWFRDEYRGSVPDNYLRRGEEEALAEKFNEWLSRF